MNLAELINLSYEMVIWFENFELSKKIYLEAFSQIAFNMNFGEFSNVDRHLDYFFEGKGTYKFKLDEYYKCFDICPIWEHTKAIDQFQQKFSEFHRNLPVEKSFDICIKKMNPNQFLLWIDLLVNLLRSICYPDWEIFLSEKIPVDLFAKWITGGEELKIVYEFVKIFKDRCKYPWDQVCQLIPNSFVFKQLNRYHLIFYFILFKFYFHFIFIFIFIFYFFIFLFFYFFIFLFFYFFIFLFFVFYFFIF